MLEMWLPVVSFYGYEVSNIGNVRSIDRIAISSNGRSKSIKGVALKPNERGDYLAVTIFQRGKRIKKSVQELVCHAFIGPKPSVTMQICHNDGDSHNNRSENLRYDTQSGNFADKVTHGTHARGERNPSAKLSAEQVSQIRAIGRSLTQADISDLYGIHQTTVSDILNRKIWAHGHA